MSLFAIGDVHGCARSLEALLDALGPGAGDHLVFVGDYTDRGPRSRETIDLLLRLEAEASAGRGPRCTFLRGNHDQMMLDFVERGEAELWHHNGGLTTLASYGTGDGEYHIPQDHVDFLRRTRLYFETPDYCFVHAGLDPALTVAENLRFGTAHTFLWTREHFAAPERRWEKPVVCGHTPRPEPLLEPDLLAIDTGCVFPHHPGLGWLSALHLPSRDWVRVPFQE